MHPEIRKYILIIEGILIDAVPCYLRIG